MAKFNRIWEFFGTEIPKQFIGFQGEQIVKQGDELGTREGIVFPFILQVFTHFSLFPSFFHTVSVSLKKKTENHTLPNVADFRGPTSGILDNQIFVSSVLDLKGTLVAYYTNGILDNKTFASDILDLNGNLMVY